MLSFIANLSDTEIALIVVSTCLYLLIGHVFNLREGRCCGNPKHDRWARMAALVIYPFILLWHLWYDVIYDKLSSAWQDWRAGQRHPLPEAKTRS